VADNSRTLPSRQPGTSGSGSQRVSPELAIALLTSCLALVRPVGMSEAEAEDWLGVAVGTVLDYPAGILDRASLEARRSCTHHSQIVPTIVREADLLVARAASLREASVPNIPAEVKQLAAPKITQADVDAMPEKLVKIGLSCGALVQDNDGNVRPAT
jgi:hypothetical protein